MWKQPLLAWSPTSIGAKLHGATRRACVGATPYAGPVCRAISKRRRSVRTRGASREAKSPVDARVPFSRRLENSTDFDPQSDSIHGLARSRPTMSRLWCPGKLTGWICLAKAQPPKQQEDGETSAQGPDQPWRSSGQIRLKKPHICSMSLQFWPHLALLCRLSASTLSAVCSTGFEPNSAQAACTRPNLSTDRSNVGRIRPTLGATRPKLAPDPPTLPQNRPTWGLFDHCLQVFSNAMQDPGPIVAVERYRSKRISNVAQDTIPLVATAMLSTGPSVP